jgi:hypothetical protein
MRIFVLPKVLVCSAHDKKLTVHVTKPSNSAINFNTMRLALGYRILCHWDIIMDYSRKVTSVEKIPCCSLQNTWLLNEVVIQKVDTRSFFKTSISVHIFLIFMSRVSD